jgi:predicted helicase
MVRSVDEILQQEFGKTLSDSGVHILDPFTGTGNFITRMMQQIKRSALPQKYAEELHCNEIMLLPYYIASMNIEHAYMERLGKGDELGEYRPFEGICLVDTFELAEPRQAGFSFMSEENTERVKRQKKAPIKVVIGNPPYNVGQTDENDDNANRAHESVDDRVGATYRARSKASSTTKLGNMYVKAFRWAADRVEDNGLIALVTNNGFLSKRVFDGMRMCISEEFSRVLILDLGGDVRDNPKLSGTTHNVFGIQPGVCVSFLVKSKGHTLHTIEYARLDEYWRKSQKLAFLQENPSILKIEKETLTPTEDGTWIKDGRSEGNEELIPLSSGNSGIFITHSMGANTNRDDWTVSFNYANLISNVRKLLETYNLERSRYVAGRDKKAFAWTNDHKKIKWSSSLKASLLRGTVGEFDEQDVRVTTYRPFTQEFIYFNKLLTHRRANLPNIFPSVASEQENVAMCVPGPGNRKSFGALIVNQIPALDLAFEKAQCFPFYTYSADGTNRRENITDWALAKFHAHYADKKITKWDIFHATYAILHHPEYRTRYAANLKRELPRIPFPPDLHAFAAAGKRLMELHIDYEKQPEYKLEQIEDPKAEVTFRVERMRLNSKDKSELRYNDFLTLRGIPLAAFDYRLGNRSALEWVIDQYRVSIDARSGIVNDPNREDDPQYILRLIGQVITVSVETQQIIAGLPSLNLPS